MFLCMDMKAGRKNILENVTEIKCNPVLNEKDIFETFEYINLYNCFYSSVLKIVCHI